MGNNELSEEDVTAIWQAVNDLQPRLEHLPSLQQGQVLSALLGVWIAQHCGEEHREKLLQWAMDGARSMVPMVDAGIVDPDVMGTKGNA